MNKIKKNLKSLLSGAALLILLLLYLRGNLPGGTGGYDPEPDTGGEIATTAFETEAPSESEEPTLPVLTTEAPAETVPETPEALTEAPTEAPEPETTQKPKETKPKETKPKQTKPAKTETAIDENGTYTSKEDVALYVHTYGHLPSNYIDKREAEAAGWKSVSGNLWDVCPGKSICAYFGNYEGKLPKKKGRKWTECDIGFKGKSRGSKRLIFSNDGLIYYTGDHYETFEQLY